jgi:hypothetical protein
VGCGAAWQAGSGGFGLVSDRHGRAGLVFSVQLRLPDKGVSYYNSVCRLCGGATLRQGTISDISPSLPFPSRFPLGFLLSARLWTPPEKVREVFLFTAWRGRACCGLHRSGGFRHGRHGVAARACWRMSWRCSARHGRRGWFGSGVSRRCKLLRGMAGTAWRGESRLVAALLGWAGERRLVVERRGKEVLGMVWQAGRVQPGKV